MINKLEWVDHNHTSDAAYQIASTAMGAFILIMDDGGETDVYFNKVPLNGDPVSIDRAKELAQEYYNKLLRPLSSEWIELGPKDYPLMVRRDRIFAVRPDNKAICMVYVLGMDSSPLMVCEPYDDIKRKLMGD